MLDIRKIAELPEAHKRDCGKPTGIGGAANRHGKERHMQITGGWVYDPDEGFAERTVCTDGEKIARISTDTKRLDAAGCYVLPLLIDLHIHGYAGADAGSADPAELERMARALLMQGVGAFCPTTMTLPEARLAAVCRCTAAYCKERHPGAQVAGIYLEGPFLAPERRGSHDEALLQNPDPELLRRLQEAGEGAVRLMTLAPELPGALPLIRMAVKQGIRVSLGHTQADYDTARAALRAGAAQCTHLLNAMTPFGHQAPGVVGAAFDVPGTMVELICDGIHVHPAMVRAMFRLFGPERVVMVSDALPPAGLPEGTYHLGSQEITVDHGRAVLSDKPETLAGAVCSLMECVRRAVSFGIPLADAVRAASWNPACALGMETRKGSLRPGQEAGAVLLDRETLETRAVIARGCVVEQ